MNTLDFTPFPVLTTQRLRLRQLLPADAANLFDLRTNEQVNRYLDRPSPKGVYEMTDFVGKINGGIATNQWLYWAICLPKDNELVGTICLWNFNDIKTIAEIGYELHPDQQGKGYMNEALQAVVAYAFGTLQLQQLEAYTHHANIGSIRLLVKNGFEQLADKVDGNNKNHLFFIIRLVL